MPRTKEELTAAKEQLDKIKANSKPVNSKKNEYMSALLKRVSRDARLFYFRARVRSYGVVKHFKERTVLLNESTPVLPFSERERLKKFPFDLIDL